MARTTPRPRISQVNADKLGRCAAQGVIAALEGKRKDENRYRLKGDPEFACVAWDAGFDMGEWWLAKFGDDLVRLPIGSPS